MSAVVILSSSPPPTPLARSPTVIDSSPFHLPLQFAQDGTGSPKLFKSASKDRNGFGEILDNAALATESHHSRPASPPVDLLNSRPSSEKAQGYINTYEGVNKTATPGGVTIEVATTGVTGCGNSEERKRSLSPQVGCGRTALQRRTDWTPIKNAAAGPVFDLDDALDSAAGFPKGLMAKFEHEPGTKAVSAATTPSANGAVSTKRRKVHLVDVQAPTKNQPKEAPNQTKARTKRPAQERPKAAARKPKTITDLATSHYLGKHITGEPAPAVGSDSSTQLREAGIIDMDDLEVLLKTPRQKKRTKWSKKKDEATKSKVLSPASALRLLDNQETIFGSASQLAQDQSTSAHQNVLPDPNSQDATQPISISSTSPGQVVGGTSKYVRRRNLWAAAGRDEDDALLHVDTQDPFDLPCLRDVFVGKDVLVSPLQTPERGRQPPHVATAFPPQATGLSISSNRHTTTALDSTKSGSRSVEGVSNIRSLHTTTGENKAERPKTVDKGPEQMAPQKPSYAGVDTCVLQKRLKAYGFKPVKKREKAIELLDMCWEAKYGKSKASEVQAEDLKQGDFLSRVHGVSSRPEPKTKKTKEKAKPKTAKPKATTDESVKKPRSRKKTVSGAEEETVVKPAVKKTPAKSRAKTLLSEQPACTRKPKDDRPGDGSEAVVLDRQRGNQATEVVETVDLTNSLPPANPSWGSQIQAAILQQSNHTNLANRNHVLNPTWHEKILMYDPIIIEELTLWLNTEGFNSIGEDGEVSSMEVRAWLESKGVCCLWKGGWRGQRSKSGDE